MSLHSRVGPFALLCLLASAGCAGTTTAQSTATATATAPAAADPVIIDIESHHNVLFVSTRVQGTGPTGSSWTRARSAR